MVAREAESQPNLALSEITRDVLSRLNAQVEIRFYSLLGETRATESLRAFSVRLDQLLSEYERAGAGRVLVTRFNSSSESNVKAAMADGIDPFNVGKGEVCYLGIAVIQNGQKVSVSRLLPEWEAAVEFDLSRAIARATSSKTALPQTFVADPSPVDTTATDEIMRSIPNLDSVSFAEGKGILCASSREEFKAAVTKMQAEILRARQRLLEAQSGKSEAEQRAALKEFQQFQAEESKKLDEIPRRLEARLSALERLKSGK